MKLLSRQSKGSQVPANSYAAAVVYSDSSWSRTIGPGAGYTWGAGPKTFVPSNPGNPNDVVELGRPGDFPEGQHSWDRNPTDNGFPQGSRWPGYVGGWQPPFYEAQTSRGGYGPGGNFMGGALLENRVAIVFTCADLISRTMASMNLLRTQASSPMPSLPWMDNPEPLLYASIVDAIKAAVNSLLLRGEAFLLATARYADLSVARWVVLNPDTVTIELDPETKVPSYYLGDIPIPRSELLHIKYQTWAGELHGVGPLEASWRSIASASAMEEWGTQLAINNGIPTAVLSSSVKLTKTQADDLKLSWYEAATSRGTLPAVLSGGLTYTPLNLKPADIGLLDLRTYDEQRIASAFGVPLWLVGLPMNLGLTYSTAQATFDYFWRATLRAMAYNISSALSGWALVRNQWIHFDNDSLIQPDLPARAKAYKDLVAQGILSVDEVRVMENVAPAGPGTTQIMAESTDGGL